LKEGENMKALVLTDKHEVHVGSFPEPPLAANAVKIAVAYCGLCGTDLHKYEGKSGSRPLKLPVPLGHEISGALVSEHDILDGIALSMLARR